MPVIESPPVADASDAGEDAGLGDALLRLARGAIADAFGAVPSGLLVHDRLDSPGATFVTLTLDGALRGCIGSLEAWRALRVDVLENARASAFRDPRFPGLTPVEFGRVRVEVSLLGTAEPFAVAGEDDAVARLRPGIDGLILAWRGRRATFLPQVWDHLPDPSAFLGELRRKAGLPRDFWSPDLTLSRYGVRKWTEPHTGEGAR